MWRDRISIITLGCPKNLVDSENLRERLFDEGFIYTEDLEKAQVILVNTCGFIEEAKRESIEEILRLKEFKKDGKKLLVFGCLAKRYKKELSREIPEIDALFGVLEEERIIEYCRTFRNEGYETSLEEFDLPRIDDCTNSYKYLKIAEGCNRGCTFCVIPSIRGRFRSFSPDEILKRAESYISSGTKELILVAQDLVSYGKEFKGYDLSALLKDLTSIDGDFWVRLLYLYPNSINKRLIEIVAGKEKVCKYLDIPLQHSEGRILRAMGRRGGRDEYRRLIKDIREAVSGVTLRTTMMVGFPGETEEEFKGLKSFIEEMEFDRLGVFTYSREEGTVASRLRGHVPRNIKEKRRQELMSLQSRISLRKNLALLGNIYRVLIDEINEGLAIARLPSQAPEIDGVVIINDSDGLRPGEFVNICVKEAFDYDLKGEVVR